jgi:hypothetical protein
LGGVVHLIAGSPLRLTKAPDPVRSSQAWVEQRLCHAARHGRLARTSNPHGHLAATVQGVNSAYREKVPRPSSVLTRPARPARTRNEVRRVLGASEIEPAPPLWPRQFRPRLMTLAPHGF